LTAAATDQLPVDARCLMKLGQDDMKAAPGCDGGCELDVGTPPRHVRRNCDTARLASLRDNGRLFPIMMRIEHDMLDCLCRQHAGEQFRGGYRTRSDQHRSP
jgi:hypothetical protein